MALLPSLALSDWINETKVLKKCPFIEDGVKGVNLEVKSSRGG